MTRGKLKKVASAITILAVVSTIVFSSSVLAGTTKEKRQSEGKKLHQATGLKEPSKEDLEWMKENMVQVKKVLPNELGLQRANEARKKKGLKALGKDKAVHKGQEVIPMSPNQNSTTKAFSTMMSAEDDSYSRAPADVETLSSSSLPTYVDNSILPYFPPIRSQGSIGSCVSFATTYYQATYMTAMARGWNVKDNNDNTNKFSPKWTFNLVNGGINGGSTPQANFRVMLENGIATWDEFPYCGESTVPKNYVEWSTDEKVWTNALNYKMDKAGYVKVADGTDTPVTSPDSPALNDIKQLLNNGYILTYGTSINSWKWSTIKDNPYTDADNEFANKDVVYMQGPSNSGHTMTVVGYNDDIWVDINDNDIVDPGENGAFRIANSYGDDWGENGFAWIAYDALNKVSAVYGASAANQQRESIWGPENLAFWITAKTSYTPDLVGKITINHAKRNQLKLELGMQEVDGTNNVTYSPFAINNSGSAEYDFDGPEDVSGGTEIPCDATFVFDFSDMFKGKDISGITKNWSIKVTDTDLDGNGALVKSFSVIDSFGNTASCNQVNQTVDGTSMLFYSTLTLGSNTSVESEWVFKNSLPFKMIIQKSYQFNDKIYAVVDSSEKHSYGLICYDPLTEQTSWIHSIDSHYYGWDLSVGYNNKIYLFGGSNVKVYDINTGVMSSKSTIPNKIENAPIVELNGKIYIISGSLTANDGSMDLTKGVMVYDTATDRWNSTADTNIARKLSGAAVLNGKIYLFGGYDNDWNRCESIEEYDPATNQWTIISSYLPCPIESLFISLNGKIYSLGMDNLNQVFEYNPSLNEWSKHCNISEPYYKFQAESLNGKIYVIGGKMNNLNSNSENVLEFTPSDRRVVSIQVGDVNGDGSVDNLDYSLIRQYVNGIIDDFPVENDLWAGDLDGDGIINSTDASLMLQKMLGEISFFPKEKVKTPNFILAEGTYTSFQSITLSCATIGATIRYTTDGSTPTSDSPIYTGFINITKSTTIKAFAQKAGLPDSDITSATYTLSIQVGDVNGDGSIDNFDHSLIRQYVNGTIDDFPVEDDLWAGDLDGDGIINDTDVSLIQQRMHNNISFFPKEQVKTPSFSLPEGIYSSTQTVILESATEGASIRYTTDGAIPTSSSQLYTGPITISNSQTIKAYALKEGMVDSDIASATYTIKVENPVISPVGGTYTSIQSITLSCATEGATIRYTTDGTTPNSNSSVYTNPITVASSKTIKAYAEKDGIMDSDVSVAEYELTIKVGDVNGDGDVDAVDYALMKIYLEDSSIDFPVGDDMWAGDLNGDGSIDAIDYSLMKMFISGQITHFPKE